MELAPLAVGFHLFGSEQVSASLHWRNGPNTIEINRAEFTALGGMALADTPGGRNELRELVDPALRDIVDQLSPSEPAAKSFMASGATVGREYADVPVLAVRVRDRGGRLAGTAVIAKPAAGTATLAAMTAGGDLRHFERMQHVARPARRPAAILFADVESSSQLARRLSTASYFALGRRLVRAADQCVIDAGGLVGRHVGDGVVAFFLAETPDRSPPLRATASPLLARFEPRSARSWSAATCNPGRSACVSACTGPPPFTSAALRPVDARSPRLAAKSTMPLASKPAPPALVLASKDLIERLEPEDATALDLDPNHLTYTPLGDLATATEKARRDAPAIAVCEVEPPTGHMRPLPTKQVSKT